MINRPKGTNDLLPKDAYKWHYIEKSARDIAKLFNAKEVRTPIFEHTELFLRGVGEGTDIVNKEMYTFLDKGGRSITLKPEGTAPAVRAYIENSLGNEALPLKMYYISPIFRYERPQAGRFRQHHQFGVEMVGSHSPKMDVEAILLADRFLNDLGIKNVMLNINSIGCSECRSKYITALKEYYKNHLDSLCGDCKNRYDSNLLRLLDCKVEGCAPFKAEAPSILDYLCDSCENHFSTVKKLLDSADVKYVINNRLVRGLDYYNNTVFEFLSLEKGKENTAICAGGRYDSLIETIGGKSAPSVGFGCGIERLLLAMESADIEIENDELLDVYIVKIGLEDNDIDVLTAL